MNTNPFVTGTYDGRELQVIDSIGRILMVNTFDDARCMAALEVPGLQKNVRLAVERRLRQLAKKNR